MKILSFIVFCFVMLIGCTKSGSDSSKVSNKDAVQSINTTESVETKIKNTGEGILIENGSITTRYTIPIINNKIMGIEDDFYISEEATRSELFPGFNGFTIALPVTIDNKNEITLIAKINDISFTEKYKISPYEIDGKILAYTTFVSFENKFWINQDGLWKIDIINNSNLLLQAEYQDKLNELFYLNVSDSPFEKIQQRNIQIGKKYTYRYFADKESIVVLYYTNDDFVFYPVLVIEPNDKNEDSSIILTWNEKTIKGHYFIKDYFIDELPTEEVTWALFESFYLE